jgi:hypothetical protein
MTYQNPFVLQEAILNAFSEKTGFSNTAFRGKLDGQTQRSELTKSCELLRDKKLRDFYRHLVVLLFKLVATGNSFGVGTKRGLGRERGNVKY